MADDPLAAKIAAIRERSCWTSSAKMKAIPGANALSSARDVPCLLAALETALEALARHQGVYADADGTVCAGCLEPVECPDTRRVTAALLGEAGTDG